MTVDMLITITNVYSELNSLLLGKSSEGVVTIVMRPVKLLLMGRILQGIIGSHGQACCLRAGPMMRQGTCLRPCHPQTGCSVLELLFHNLRQPDMTHCTCDLETG